MNERDVVQQLERASELADARLGVAEDFAWPLSALSAALAYSATSNWYWCVGAGVFAFVISTIPLRRAADKAEDEYFRAAQIGKYSELMKSRTDGQT